MNVVSRRSLAALAFGSVLGRESPSLALDRTPYGGRLRLRVPWAIERLDPYVSDDPLSALFSPFVTETLFAQQGATLFPVLTEALPTLEAGSARVRLRADLRTADGVPFLAGQAVRCLERARSGRAIGLFAEWDALSVDAADPRVFRVRCRRPNQVARILSSSACAMTGSEFSTVRQRGLGAFTAEIANGKLLLSRNASAARGPAFLDSVVVERADSLRDGLAQFEAGESAVGWFGAGLYRPRPKALPLAGGPLGWLILRAERGLGRWGAAGVVQSLLDALDLSKLGHLGVNGLPARGSPERWGGPSTPLLVDQACPHFVEAAQVLASMLSQPAHEWVVKRVPRAELARAAKAGEAVMVLDFVRRLSAAPEATALALLAAQDLKLAAHPPKLSLLSAQEVARTLPFGVVGELSVNGACDARFINLAKFELGDVWFKEKA